MLCLELILLFVISFKSRLDKFCMTLYMIIEPASPLAAGSQV